MEPNTTINQQPQGKGRAKRIAGLVLVALLFVGLAVYGVYAGLNNQKLRDDIAKKESENISLAGQIDTLQKSATAPKTETITETLPNNKTATYANNEANRNILFWHTADDSQTTYVLLSHKDIQLFLSSVDTETIVALCGTDGSLKGIKYNISVGMFNTSSKTLTSPQNQSCLDILASTENSNITLRNEAKTVKQKVSDEVGAFIENVTIK